MYKQCVANDGIALKYYYLYFFSSFTCYLKNAAIRRNKNPTLGVTSSPFIPVFFHVHVLQTPTQLFHVYFCCRHIPVSWDEVAVNLVYAKSVGFSFLREMSGPRTVRHRCSCPAPRVRQCFIFISQKSLTDQIRGPYTGLWSEAEILLCDWIITGSRGNQADLSSLSPKHGIFIISSYFWTHIT